MARCWRSSTSWKRSGERSPELEIACYERDRGFVLSRFREGEFDDLDAANEVFETDFFRFIRAKRYLEELAQSYPSPRKKQEVPTWFFIASNLRVAMRLVPGNAHDCPIFYELLDAFVAEVGEGVIRRLVLDRGFIDGERIAHCKRDLGLDVLIPVRKDMDIYQDVLGLLKLKTTKFREYRPPERQPVDAPRLSLSPEPVRRRELKRQRTVEAKKAKLPPPPPREVLVRSEVAGIDDLRTFTKCSVPLNAIVSRDTFADGHTDVWVLLDTKPLTPSDGPAARRAEYAIRTDIEEGHRRLKCFWDMTRFTSRAFSLVLNQIVFVLLAYNLLQIFLRAQSNPPLSRCSRPRQLDLAMTTAAVIIIYSENRFATLTPLEYTELLLTLGEEARKKILAKTRRLRQELGQALRLARAP